MKLNKSQINKLKNALKKAYTLENMLANQMGEIALIINDATGISGYVDYLTGDGFGFTPESNNDTHVGVDEIIKWAENGKAITEELIVDKLCF